MGARVGRVLVVALACVVWLSGCETSTKLGDPKPAITQSALPSPPTAPDAAADDQADEPTTGAITGQGDPPPDAVRKGLRGKGPNDDLSLGKKYFRSAKFGLAKRHFRRAAELHPRDLESWLGLAASYDRLRRFDHADRAYDQAMKIAGPTADILNNKGYSYMLRGDYARARETLLAAHAQDPANPYIKNNLELLQVSSRKSKAIR